MKTRCHLIVDLISNFFKKFDSNFFASRLDRFDRCYWYTNVNIRFYWESSTIDGRISTGWVAGLSSVCYGGALKSFTTTVADAQRNLFMKQKLLLDIQSTAATCWCLSVLRCLIFHSQTARLFCVGVHRPAAASIKMPCVTRYRDRRENGRIDSRP